MTRTRLQQTIQDAVASGLLPSSAVQPAEDSRPWPVVVLTAIGAWLAAIPLMGFAAILMGKLISNGVGPYIVGLVVLSAAVVTLRKRTTLLFVEQMAVPTMLVGAGLLAFGLFRDLPYQLAAAALAMIAIFIGWTINRAWMRALLGASAACLVMLACLPSVDSWFALHSVFAIWVAAGWCQRNFLKGGVDARHAAALESLKLGWLLVTLAGFAFWSGMTFMVNASFGNGMVGEIAHELFGRSRADIEGSYLIATLSLLLALGGAVCMGQRWQATRQLWCAGVAFVLMAICWFMPSLGAVLLALAISCTSGRSTTAGAAGLAAAWIIGAFYSQMNMPLAAKAGILVVAGIVLASLAVWGTRKKDSTFGAPLSTIEAARPVPRAAQMAISGCAMLVLLAANAGIWQKEDLVAHGKPVFVELVPVDPRSLMQGDYMRLNFSLPDNAAFHMDHLLTSRRPQVIAKRDGRGVATLLRVADGLPHGSGEFLLELTPKDGRWILVTDAWFFKEGEGERWAQARYGEFRVGPDGRALLVGLRGADLQSL